MTADDIKNILDEELYTEDNGYMGCWIVGKEEASERILKLLKAEGENYEEAKT